MRKSLPAKPLRARSTPCLSEYRSPRGGPVPELVASTRHRSSGTRPTNGAHHARPDTSQRRRSLADPVRSTEHHSRPCPFARQCIRIICAQCCLSTTSDRRSEVCRRSYFARRLVGHLQSPVRQGERLLRAWRVSPVRDASEFQLSPALRSCAIKVSRSINAASCSLRSRSMVSDTSRSRLRASTRVAPLSFHLQHRIGGVPLRGLLLALLSMSCSGGVVCLALSCVGRFAPAGLARIAPICHGTWFTRDSCH